MLLISLIVPFKPNRAEPIDRSTPPEMIVLRALSVIGSTPRSFVAHLTKWIHML
ncbi:MAG: hypothetical protein QXV30_02245 [Desulfurococcaceae archaeon]